MSERQIKAAERLVREHGFNVKSDVPDGIVYVELPYVTSSGQAGTMWEPCETFDAVRIALGY